MKSATIKLGFLAALLSVFLISCSELCDTDDVNTTALQYRVTVAKPIIAGISYRAATGELVTEDGILQSLELWYAHEDVEAPFSALKQVVFVNNHAEEVTYSLGIYLNGKLIKTENGSVLPQQQETAIIEYAVAN